jgi:hypothetical protein
MVYTLASEANFLEAYPKVSGVQGELEQERATVCHQMRDVLQEQLGDTMVNRGTLQEGVQEGVQDGYKEKPAVDVHP